MIPLSEWSHFSESLLNKIIVLAKVWHVQGTYKSFLSQSQLSGVSLNGSILQFLTAITKILFLGRRLGTTLYIFFKYFSYFLSFYILNHLDTCEEIYMLLFLSYSASTVLLVVNWNFSRVFLLLSTLSVIIWVSGNSPIFISKRKLFSGKYH